MSEKSNGTIERVIYGNPNGVLTFLHAQGIKVKEGSPEELAHYLNHMKERPEGREDIIRLHPDYKLFEQYFKKNLGAEGTPDAQPKETGILAGITPAKLMDKEMAKGVMIGAGALLAIALIVNMTR